LCVGCIRERKWENVRKKKTEHKGSPTPPTTPVTATVRGHQPEARRRRVSRAGGGGAVSAAIGDGRGGVGRAGAGGGGGGGGSGGGAADGRSAVFSLKSGQEINNPWGPNEGGPEGTGNGKVQSTPVPKRGTKVLRQRPEGARDPREQETQGTVGFSSRHEGEAETSPQDPPRRAPSGATAGQHTPAPRPLGGKRGAFAGWPLFGPNPRKYVEASDPREPVPRPPIGAGQCRSPVMRKSSPSKQCEIQSNKNQVRQPPPAAAKISKRTWPNQSATSQPRSGRGARTT